MYYIYDLIFWAIGHTRSCHTGDAVPILSLIHI